MLAYKILEYIIVFRSWNAGKEFPTSLLLISQHRRLFSAARTIQMWCLKNKTLLKSFTGHSSIVSIMKSVTIANEDGENDTFVVTGGRNDRILNAWNISGEVIFLLTNFCHCIS